MGSKAIELLLLKAPAPALLSFRRRASARAFVQQQQRFYAAAKSSGLEPPNVERLAETARISVTPQQIEEFAPKIQQVVDWFGQLQAVDLQSIEPALRADTEDDNLRNDVPEVFDNRDAMISAVPSYEDSYLKVPKVLNKE